MGKKQQRQPDWWVNVGATYPKGESARLKLAIALLTFSGAIIAALIVSGILPEALGNVWDRMVKHRPPSSDISPSESEGVGSRAQVTVGHRHVLPLPSPAAGQAGQELLDVAAGGGRFVAVGWTGTTTDSDGVVWISKDGESWTPATDPTDAFRHRAGNQKLNGVVASTKGFVAVGSDGAAAAVWISTDGQEWAQAPHEAGAFSEGGGGGQFMRSVAKHGRTLVAVGTRGTDGGREAAGWYLSTEGVWRRATVRSSPAKPSADMTMRDVAWIDDKLVAVGTARTSGTSSAGYDAAVWTSHDGRVWTQLPTADVDARCTDGGCRGDQAMSSVATDKRSAVAVGLAGVNQCERRAAVWRSVDHGSTWRRVLDAKALDGKAMRMNGVAPTGGGFLAVGSQGCPGQQRAAVWASPDGLSWRLVSVRSRPGSESMAGAALSPQRGVVAGSRGDKLATASGLTWRIARR
jgi:hypothetical protein